MTSTTAAVTLRQEGADGTITLIGAENKPPYERPPLSKAYLRGETPFETALVRPPVFYAEQGIETIALKPPVAAQLGTTAGLLVVYVEPSTAASEAGLQAGDVIQSINGKPVSTFKATTQPASFKLEIVRNKERLVVMVPANKQ